MHHVGRKYPSNQLGLASSVHWLGEDGITGDIDNLFIMILHQAIRDGLKNSNNIAKVDMLNFDKCLIVQVGMVEEYPPLVEQIVASGESIRIATCSAMLKYWLTASERESEQSNYCKSERTTSGMS